MKKLIFAFSFFGAVLFNAQEDNSAFSGKDDLRLNVGANFQKGGTGVQAALDYGLGQSFSIGAQAGYLLGVKSVAGVKPGFGDRFDMKVRSSAHLGGVIGLPTNVDIYPGLDLSLKNFGGHFGTRVFFAKGFGLFAEMQFPIARFKPNALGFDRLNNQFSFSFGTAFDLNMQ